MTHIEELAVKTALNQMLKKGHFDICTVRDVAKIMNVNPDGKAYDMLHALHCIDYGRMPQELREAIPSLIRECLSLSPIYEFEQVKSPVFVVSQSPVKRFLKMIS